MTDKLMLLAEESEANPFEGALTGRQGIIGIVLIVTGILLVYIGIKVVMGYKFLPDEEIGVPQEDTYVPAKAKVLQKKKTTMPGFNGGEETVFVEWKIGYEADGEKYTQIIPDNGYKKGEFIDIKYNPDDPQEFYLDDEKSKADTAAEERKEPEEKKNPMGYVFIVIALLLAAVGVMLIL